MSDGVSVYGNYESSAWTACEVGPTVLLPPATPGVFFGADVRSRTVLSDVEVRISDAGAVAGITADGATGVELESVRVGGSGFEFYGIDLVNSSAVLDGIEVGGTSYVGSGVRAARSIVTIKHSTLANNAASVTGTLAIKVEDGELTLSESTVLVDRMTTGIYVDELSRADVSTILVDFEVGATRAQRSDRGVGIDCRGECNVTDSTILGSEEGLCETNWWEEACRIEHKCNVCWKTFTGISITGSGLVARTLIDAGNALDNTGLEAVGRVRVENNRIRVDANHYSATRAIGALIGGDVDFHSNTIELRSSSGGYSYGAWPECSSAILWVASSGPSIRNNVFEQGAKPFPLYTKDCPYPHIVGASASPLVLQNNAFAVDRDYVSPSLVLYREGLGDSLRTIDEVNALTSTSSSGNIEVSSAIFCYFNGCVDNGTPASAPLEDFDGTPRDVHPDIGAYEYFDHCAGETCGGHGVCQHHSFDLEPNCLCYRGYTLSAEDALDCVDLDECVTNNGGCDSLTECINLPGSRACGPCPEGYAGDGEAGCRKEHVASFVDCEVGAGAGFRPAIAFGRDWVRFDNPKFGMDGVDDAAFATVLAEHPAMTPPSNGAPSEVLMTAAYHTVTSFDEILFVDLEDEANWVALHGLGVTSSLKDLLTGNPQAAPDGSAYRLRVPLTADQVTRGGSWDFGNPEGALMFNACRAEGATWSVNDECGKIGPQFTLAPEEDGDPPPEPDRRHTWHALGELWDNYAMDHPWRLAYFIGPTTETGIERIKHATLVCIR